MGAETALFAALTLGSGIVSARAQQASGKAEARALIEEGNINAANKAKQTKARADAQRVSFLNSGLELEGTPQNVIDSTLVTGLEDVGQIATNYNRAASNRLTAARSAAIGNLMSSVGNLTLLSAGSLVGSGALKSGLSSSGSFAGQTLPWTIPANVTAGQTLPWRV